MNAVSNTTTTTTCVLFRLTRGCGEWKCKGVYLSLLAREIGMVVGVGVLLCCVALMAGPGSRERQRGEGHFPAIPNICSYIGTSRTFQPAGEKEGTCGLVGDNNYVPTHERR